VPRLIINMDPEDKDWLLLTARRMHFSQAKLLRVILREYRSRCEGEGVLEKRDVNVSDISK